jgi:regulator of sigma E protease
LLYVLPDTLRTPIGFGKALWERTDSRGTVWKICWLPLGGYVKMHGQERPEDVSEAERAAWREEHTFHHKSLGRRAIVVAAGPIANFLLAVLLFAGLFAFVGKPLVQPIVDGLSPGGAAELAGLQVGDRIVSLDGRKVDDFGDIRAIIAPRPGQRLDVTVERSGQEQTYHVVLGSQGTGKEAIGLLGISGSQKIFVPQTLGQATLGAVTQSWQISAETLHGLWQMIVGHRGTTELSGPLRIAQLSGEVAQYGPANLVSFIAIISINLGLINLFPIPVLDGGHLMFYLVEAIRGRPLSPEASEYLFRAGLVLLLVLFIYATWNDIMRLGWFNWIFNLIG